MSGNDAAVLGSLGFGMIIFLLIGLLIYFLPFVIALIRKHKDKLGIFVLNLFLGWSVIGWVVALVWSVKSYDNR